MVEKVTGKESVLEALEFEIIRTAAQVNVDARLNIQDHQVPDIAKMIFETYKNESLEDFILMLRRGAMGIYDEKLLRLDGSVIFHWMTKYLDEKYQVVETKLMEEKESLYDIKPKEGKSFLDALIAAVGEPPKEDRTNQKENAYQKERIGMDVKRGTKEDYERRELHGKYLLANYDPLTGFKMPHWKEEVEWLKGL